MRRHSIILLFSVTSSNLHAFNLIADSNGPERSDELGGFLTWIETVDINHERVIGDEQRETTQIEDARAFTLWLFIILGISEGKSLFHDHLQDEKIHLEHADVLISSEGSTNEYATRPLMALITPRDIEITQALLQTVPINSIDKIEAKET